MLSRHKIYITIDKIPSLDGKESFILCHDDAGNKFG